MTAQSSSWDGVQQRASVLGSTVLARFNAERDAARRVHNASGNGASQTVASSDPNVVELLGYNRASSGVVVTPDSAMRNATVYACDRLIAGAISTMPAHIYRQAGSTRERIEQDPLWWLLNEEPTPRFTSAAMWEQVVSQMLLRESGFVYIGRSNSGTVRELIPLPYDACKPRRTDKGDRLEYSISDVRRFGADQDDVLHFPGFGFDGLKALSVIQYAARNAAGNAMAMDDYSGKFFAGGAHPSIVLTTDGKLTPQQKDDLREAFAAKYSGMDNAHRLPLVLTEGIKQESVSISAEDAQLLDARKFQVIDIARAFGVPPHMIGETSGASNWGTGLEQLAIAFVRYTLQPHLARIQQELNRKLFRNAGRYIEFNRDALLQGDSKAQSEAFKAALGGPGAGPGWQSVDDIRRMVNLPPLGGVYEKPFYPESKADAAKPKESSANETGASE